MEFTHLPPDVAEAIEAYDNALQNGTLRIIDWPHDQPVMFGVNPFADE